MANNEIIPDKITTPIQLLASWLVALIVLDGAFLTAAGVVKEPAWLPGSLVIAAISYVPLFLGLIYILQTRFRPEMQSDELYSTYLKQQYDLAFQIRQQLSQLGFSLGDLPQRQKINSTDIDKIRPIIEGIRETIKSLQEKHKLINPELLKILAEGEIGIKNWSNAAMLLDEYIKLRSDDFEANFSRGVAYANIKQGISTDICALQAYNDAVASMPKSLDGNFRARLFIYRGAILKRMRRFEDALSNFKIAEQTVTADYEKSDLSYNFASTYALMGDKNQLMEVVRKTNNKSTVMPMIRDKLNDYFKEFSNDEEFLRAIEAADK